MEFYCRRFTLQCTNSLYAFPTSFVDLVSTEVENSHCFYPSFHFAPSLTLLQNMKCYLFKFTAPKRINFAGKLEEDDSVTKVFIAEKQQKNILNFSLDLLILKE